MLFFLFSISHAAEHFWVMNLRQLCNISVKIHTASITMWLCCIHTNRRKWLHLCPPLILLLLLPLLSRMHAPSASMRLLIWALCQWALSGFDPWIQLQRKQDRHRELERASKDVGEVTTSCQHVLKAPEHLKASRLRGIVWEDGLPAFACFLCGINWTEHRTDRYLT